MATLWIPHIKFSFLIVTQYLGLQTPQTRQLIDCFRFSLRYEKRRRCLFFAHPSLTRSRTATHTDYTTIRICEIRFAQ